MSVLKGKKRWLWIIIKRKTEKLKLRHPVRIEAQTVIIHSDIKAYLNIISSSLSLTRRYSSSCCFCVCGERLGFAVSRHLCSPSSEHPKNKKVRDQEEVTDDLKVEKSSQRICAGQKESEKTITQEKHNISTKVWPQLGWQRNRRTLEGEEEADCFSPFVSAARHFIVLFWIRHSPKRSTLLRRD